MSIIDRTLSFIKERKAKIRNGGINSIQSPFIRFLDDFLGVEQQKYYVVTGSTKAAKTQLATYVFIYNTLLYCMKYPDKARCKIFYYPMEEAPEDVVLRFESFILNEILKTRISVKDLTSTCNKEVSQDIIDKLENDLKPYLDFFNEHVEFSTSRNPTGVWNEVKRYCEENGTVHKKKQKVKDDNGDTHEVDVFDYYEKNDPDEYVIVFFDHLSLVQLERGMTLKQSADKLSEYFVVLRNRYKIIPVLVQQQTAEMESLDAFKEKKLRPTAQGLADTKYSGRDCNVLLGIFSPFRHELPEYKGYDITRLRDNCRFLEVILNRGGSAGGQIGLFFDGATCNFAELPKSTDATNMGRLYAYLDKIRKQN